MKLNQVPTTRAMVGVWRIGPAGDNPTEETPAPTLTRRQYTARCGRSVGELAELAGAKAVTEAEGKRVDRPGGMGALRFGQDSPDDPFVRAAVADPAERESKGV